MLRVFVSFLFNGKYLVELHALSSIVGKPAVCSGQWRRVQLLVFVPWQGASESGHALSVPIPRHQGEKAEMQGLLELYLSS